MNFILEITGAATSRLKRRERISAQFKNHILIHILDTILLCCSPNLSPSKNVNKGGHKC